MSDNHRIEELRRRVQADPASIAFAALAEEYRRVGHFDEAIETCVAGLKRHPSYLSAHVTLGRALIEVGRFDEAEQELQLVLKAAPENLAAIRGMAEIHHRRRDNIYDAEARALSELPVHAESAAAATDAARETPAYDPPVSDPPAYQPPPYEPSSYESVTYESAAPEMPAFAATTCEPPVAESAWSQPLTYEPPPYDPPGTFELPAIGTVSHIFAPAPAADRSAEIEALERFLVAVTAARETSRAR